MNSRPNRAKKKVYPKERRDLLEAYEGGDSMPSLATRTGRNIRTIKSQLQKGMEERELALARTGMYREALMQHNQGMLTALGTVRGALYIPNHEMITVLPHFESSSSTAVAAIGIRFSGGQAIYEPIHDEHENVRLMELAREHLRREKDLWRGLDDWHEVALKYAQACYDLGEHVGNIVIETGNFGLMPANIGEDAIHQPFVIWACRRGIEIASGAPLVDDEELLSSSSSQVRYGGSTIATLSDPAKQEATRKLFLKLIQELPTNPLTSKTISLKANLEDKLPSLTRLLGDVLLLGLIPGRCSVCQKLGL